MASFGRITIVGLGLIGGSLGLAIRRRRLARDVVGLSRSKATARRAQRGGAVDVGTTDPRRAVQGAELVILATPVDRLIPEALRLSRWMRPGSVLTDVGSTKAVVVRALERRLARRGIAFIGGHPLAGSERRGIAAATAALFDRAAVILTPTARTNRQACARVAALWRRLGCRVISMAPARHDRLLATLSHLPHVMAYCLVRSARSAAARLATRSFLEMTRVAKSDPGLWQAICSSNRAPLLNAMARFERQWRTFRRELVAGRSAALRRRLASAQAARLRLPDA